MDGEGGGVDRAVPLDHFAQMIDQNQIGDTDVSEIDAERIDPKTIGLLGGRGGNKTRNYLIESITGKQAEGCGEVCLAVAALLGKGGEGARRRQVLDSSWSFGDGAGFGHVAKDIKFGVVVVAPSTFSAALRPLPAAV